MKIVIANWKIVAGMLVLRPLLHHAHLKENDEPFRGYQRLIGNYPQNQTQNEHYKSVVVTNEDGVIKLANKGYDCQILGENKWLMRRKLANGLDSHG